MNGIQSYRWEGKKEKKFLVFPARPDSDVRSWIAIRGKKVNPGRKLLPIDPALSHGKLRRRIYRPRDNND